MNEDKEIEPTFTVISQDSPKEGEPFFVDVYITEDGRCGKLIRGRTTLNEYERLQEVFPGSCGNCAGTISGYRQEPDGCQLNIYFRSNFKCNRWHRIGPLCPSCKEAARLEALNEYLKKIRGFGYYLDWNTFIEMLAHDYNTIAIAKRIKRKKMVR